MTSRVVTSARVGGAAVQARTPSARKAAARIARLLPRFPEGIDHVARGIGRRREDHLGRGILELLDVIALDPLELDLEHPRLRPFAILAEPHLAGDGIEAVAADVVSDLSLVEALRRLDGCAQHLQ